MKKILLIALVFSLAGTVLPARAGEFVTENRTSVRLYGGICWYGPYVPHFETMFLILKLPPMMESK